MNMALYGKNLGHSFIRNSKGKGQEAGKTGDVGGHM